MVDITMDIVALAGVVKFPVGTDIYDIAYLRSRLPGLLLAFIWAHAYVYVTVTLYSEEYGGISDQPLIGVPALFEFLPEGSG